MCTETPPSSSRELNINQNSSKDLHPLHPDYVSLSREDDKLMQNNNKIMNPKKLSRESTRIRKVQFLGKFVYICVLILILKT